MRNAPKQLGQSNSTDVVAAAINRISQLGVAEVRAEWRARFGIVPPKGVSRDLLVRQLAWDIQEKALGGHDAAARKILRGYGRQEAEKVVLFRRLKPGTTVIREYQGIRHIVLIAEGGFVWEGKTYASLSAIARAITGARWNGPRFFGLRGREAAVPDRKAS